MGQMAQQATTGLMSGLGVDTPEVKQQKQLQEVLGATNPQDPNSLAEAARKLMGMGLQAEAAQLMKQAQEVAESGAKVGKDLAQSNMYGAQAQKAMTGAVDTTLNDNELYMKFAEEGGHEYAIQKIKELRGTKPFAPTPVPKLDVSQGFTEFLAAKGMTADQFMQLPEETRVGMTSAYEKSPFYKNPVTGKGGGTTKEIQNAQMLADLQVKEKNGTLTPVEEETLKNLRAN
jgi:hypothetical protein